MRSNNWAETELELVNQFDLLSLDLPDGHGEELLLCSSESLIVAEFCDQLALDLRAKSLELGLQVFNLDSSKLREGCHAQWHGKG